MANIRPYRCPFCGSEGLRASAFDHFTCKCSNKDCTAHKLRIPLDEWNSRPQELRALLAERDALREENAKLKHQLDDLLITMSGGT